MVWDDTVTAYVRQGELCLHVDSIQNWGREARDQNRGKSGRPFLYPETFITLVAITKVVFHLPARQVEWLFRGLSKFINIDAPDHTTIKRRISCLNLELDARLVNSEDPVAIVVDSTGVKVNSGRELQSRISDLERGWLRFHLSVDTRKKQVLNLEIHKGAYGGGTMGGQSQLSMQFQQGS